MKTLEQFAHEKPGIPLGTVWLLSELAEYRGKQELFIRQSPQKLKMLQEHALIESAVSSNRIEGVEIEQKRVGTVVFGKGLLQDRSEEEVRGYQEALRWIHEDAASIPVNEETILRLHRHCKPGAWDAGAFKGEDGEIIEKHADGRTSLRFKPLAAVETPKAVCDLCSLSERLLREKEIPPLVVWAAQNLDFLCIHPFRDGNGRVSRILLLLSLYQLGFVAGKYISLERVIESSKERYYETLKASSRHWHAGSHDPWPYINYLLYTLKEVYALFAERFESAALPVGGKTEMVRRAVLGFRQSFHIAELVKQCPDVSMDMIRKVLKDMRQEKLITCNGRGKQATWSLLGNG